MWKSLMRAALETFAMSDPVCYMHYLDWKREAELRGEARPYHAPSRQEMLRPMGGVPRPRKEVSV